jgi:STE24 endopeptidase
MSEMTATRTGLRVGTLFLFAVGWALAARALWQTEVPDGLELPDLDPRAYFSRAELRRAARHETFLRVDLLLALLAQLGALALVVRRAPRLAARFPGPALVRGAVLGLIAFGAAWLARLPFGLAAHWWERRYGLATRGYAAWLWHRLPGLGELAVLLGALLAAMLLARLLGRRWWLAAAPLTVAVAALLVFLQPLVGPTLRSPPPRVAAAVEEVAGGIPVRVERASRRTRRANAEALGLGATRRIVLWDTLLDGRFTPAEIRFVAAHEAAHLQRRHALRGLAWFALFALPCAFVAARITERGGGPAEPSAIPLLLLAVAVLQLAALPVVGAITRRYEAEADWLALERTRDPAAATSLFARFSRVNVADPKPPQWAFVVLADHPVLLDRIAMAEAFAAGAGSAGARSRADQESQSRKVARLSANQSRGGPGASGRFLIPSRVVHFE